jgi:superfamily I DNA/RNA helicase
LTLQKAKGLQAKMVVVVNCLEGCVPHIDRDYDRERQKQEDLAEQERLFFVALTRTTKILLISSTGIMRRGDVARRSIKAGTGWYWSETPPSRFIDMLGASAPRPRLGEDYVRDM